MAGKTQVDVHRGDLGAQLSVMHPQVRAHGAQLLTSMISGLDDGDDPQSLVALEAMLGLAKLLGLVEPWDLRSVLLHVAVRIRPFFDSVGWAGAGRHRGPPRAHSQPAHPGACFLTLLPLPRSLGSTCALGPRSCVTIAPSRAAGRVGPADCPPGGRTVPPPLLASLSSPLQVGQQEWREDRDGPGQGRSWVAPVR